MKPPGSTPTVPPATSPFAATRAVLRHRPEFVHVDWTSRGPSAQSGLRAGIMRALFRLDVLLARWLGAQIVLTLEPEAHEPARPDRERRLQRWLARRSRWIRVHSEDASTSVVRALDISPERVRVVSAGSRAGLAADELPRGENAGPEVPPSLKARVRRGVMASGVRLMHVSGVTRAGARRQSHAGSVLAYHNVLPTEWIGPAFPYAVDIGVDAFEEQLDYIGDRYGFLPAADAGKTGGVVLSFDDGMLNAIDVVAPILERRGITAIFAVIGGHVSGAYPHVWRDHLYLFLRARDGAATRLPMDGFRTPVPVRRDESVRYVDRIRDWILENRIEDVYGIVRETLERNGAVNEASAYRPLRFRSIDATQMRALRRAGHVIASHCWSHRILAGLSETAQLEELRRSREWLTDALGEPVRTIVYPYGHPGAVSHGIASLARAAGYERGYMNVADDTGDPMLRPRYSMPPSANPAEIDVTLSGLRAAWRRRGLTAESQPVYT